MQGYSKSIVQRTSTTSSEKTIENLSKNNRKFDRKSARNRVKQTGDFPWQNRSNIDRKTTPRAIPAKKRSRSVPKTSEQRPGASQRASRERAGASRECPGASRSVPRASRSVSGAFLERPGSAPMCPRSPQRPPGAVFEQFGFDFGSPGGGLGTRLSDFSSFFGAPSFACAASATRRGNATKQNVTTRKGFDRSVNPPKKLPWKFGSRQGESLSGSAASAARPLQ